MTHCLLKDVHLSVKCYNVNLNYLDVDVVFTLVDGVDVGVMDWALTGSSWPTISRAQHLRKPQKFNLALDILINHAYIFSFQWCHFTITVDIHHCNHTYISYYHGHVNSPISMNFNRILNRRNGADAQKGSAPLKVWRQIVWSEAMSLKPE